MFIIFPSLATWLAISSSLDLPSSFSSLIDCNKSVFSSYLVFSTLLFGERLLVCEKKYWAQQVVSSWQSVYQKQTNTFFKKNRTQIIFSIITVYLKQISFTVLSIKSVVFGNLPLYQAFLLKFCFFLIIHLNICLLFF